MAKREWKDEISRDSNKYLLEENEDGTVSLTRKAIILQEGTPVNAENMNGIERDKVNIADDSKSYGFYTEGFNKDYGFFKIAEIKDLNTIGFGHVRISLAESFYVLQHNYAAILDIFVHRNAAVNNLEFSLNILKRKGNIKIYYNILNDTVLEIYARVQAGNGAGAWESSLMSCNFNLEKIKVEFGDYLKSEPSFTQINGNISLSKTEDGNYTADAFVIVKGSNKGIIMQNDAGQETARIRANDTGSLVVSTNRWISW